MLIRRAVAELSTLLAEFPAVALLGARQVGKTTLAQAIAAERPSAVMFDLERPSDATRLADPELFLAALRGRLVILDEVQRAPHLFPLLRSEIDARRRAGERAGQFLLLGSASPDLIRGSSESLAGRLARVELTPVRWSELAGTGISAEMLWLRGGFPDSLLAGDEGQSLRWREAFVASFLERDIPQFGLRLPPLLIHRFWTMLAHQQGATLNAARLAASLGISGGSVRSHLDLLAGCFLVRLLEPWAGRSAKRLVKAPKVYLRDSGLVHQLLGIADVPALFGHPVCGTSWEGWIIEQLCGELPSGWRPSYYRSGGGAELDLVLEGPDACIAIEIKRSLTPQPGRGFHAACEDLRPAQRWCIVPGEGGQPLRHGVLALGLDEALARLRAVGGSAPA